MDVNKIVFYLNELTNSEIFSSNPNKEIIVNKQVLYTPTQLHYFKKPYFPNIYIQKSILFKYELYAIRNTNSNTDSNTDSNTNNAKKIFIGGDIHGGIGKIICFLLTSGFTISETKSHFIIHCKQDDNKRILIGDYTPLRDRADNGKYTTKYNKTVSSDEELERYAFIYAFILLLHSNRYVICLVGNHEYTSKFPYLDTLPLILVTRNNEGKPIFISHGNLLLKDYEKRQDCPNEKVITNDNIIQYLNKIFKCWINHYKNKDNKLNPVLNTHSKILRDGLNLNALFIYGHEANEYVTFCDTPPMKKPDNEIVGDNPKDPLIYPRDYHDFSYISNYITHYLKNEQKHKLMFCCVDTTEDIYGGFPSDYKDKNKSDDKESEYQFIYGILILDINNEESEWKKIMIKRDDVLNSKEPNNFELIGGGKMIYNEIIVEENVNKNRFIIDKYDKYDKNKCLNPICIIVVILICILIVIVCIINLMNRCQSYKSLKCWSKQR
jgi:hypothetical protein